MKPGMSTLNPHAPSYIPLSKPEKKPCATTNQDSITGDSSPSGGNTEPNLGSPRPSQPFDFNACGIEESSLLAKDSRKVHQSICDSNMQVEDSELELAYLQTIFPNFSKKSLAGVYSVAGGNMDSAIEMMSQLMIDHVDISSNLPETLDIGDVPESETLPKNH